MTKIVVLGAGPAGVAAAFALTRHGRADVTVLERRGTAGGNAGSFNLGGVWCDFGSHRLHPAAGAEIIGDIKALLGSDLLLRPRHGRIRLQGRWIGFPLKPFDLLTQLPVPFVAALLRDMVLKSLPRRRPQEETFATVLQQGLGPALSDNFYFPYVRKLWGLAPDDLAPILAKRRVSGNSIAKVLGKLARQLTGGRTEQGVGFYYPKQGFGQITQRLKEAAAEQGAAFEFDAQISAVCHDGGGPVGVRYEQDGRHREIAADAIWSTLPIGALIGLCEPAAPTPVRLASQAIRFRGMILIYLVLACDRFTEYDAHYFPELAIPVSRLSEPKNYSASTEPTGVTVLCAELPADPGDDHWALSDAELGQRLVGWLGNVGLPVAADVVEVTTRRLAQAYPVYDREYEQHFDVMDNWLTSLPRLLTFGRQGLFAHDNTHHAMAMAYAAAECLGSDGGFDLSRWAEHRRSFEDHVVED